MKKLFFSLATVLFFATSTFAKTNPDIKPKKTSGISFTENKGQVHDQNYKPRPDVLYGVMAGNLAVHIKNKGVSYQLNRVDEYKEVEDPKTKIKRSEIGQQTIYRIDLTWLDANTNFTQTEDKVLPGYNNYYIENCPNGALHVKSYEGITLNNLYNGINLHYYEKNGELKHDYIVAPHADYTHIKLKVEGATVELTEKGSLILSTPLGKIEEGRPIVFQKGKELKAKWVHENTILKFEIENYDPEFELIIDPITRLWGTYYGDAGSDFCYSSSIDGSGNVFMAGYTSSGFGTVIATTGSHQQTYAGLNDAYVAKFNSSGIRQWGTYYGGSGSETGNSCATDGLGNVYLTGYTDLISGTVIATSGSHQQTNGGSIDAFLVKFNSNGIRQWGTFCGGTGDDYGYSCSCDGFGNIYLAGYSASSTGTAIATPGSHQPSFGGGTFSAFLEKFNSSGQRQWGTYYGGTGYSDAYSCATDGAGNVFLAGNTQSASGIAIASTGCHQQVFGGGNLDAYLVKFDGSGVRQWGTYYGGGVSDFGYACSTDGLGNVFLTGSTQSGSGTAIASSTGHQQTIGGSFDAYLVKFSSSGTRLWGTYYGGSGSDVGYSCATDIFGNIYFSGYEATNTGTSIASAGGYQQNYGGGTWDAFLAKFNTNGLRIWGTYYGGTGPDYGYSCSVDGFGNPHLAGTTSTSGGTIIASPGSHQQSYGGGSEDAYLVKFVCPVLSPLAQVNSPVCQNSALNFSATITGSYSPTYFWSGPNSFTSSLQNPVIINSSTLNVGVYTLTVDNTGCIESATTQVSTVLALPIISVNSGSICSGNTFTIAPSGAFTFTVQGGSNSVTPTVNTTYSVTGTSSLGCISASAAICNVIVQVIPTVSVNSGSICSGKSFTIIPTGANIYTIQGASIYTIQSGSSILSPTANASYSVSGTSSLGCPAPNIAISNVTVNSIPTLAVNSGSICSGNSFTIIPTGANTYTIQGGSSVVIPNSSTTYSVLGTSTQGCLSLNSVVSTVTVYATPTIVVNSGTICQGESFTINPIGANTYTLQGGSLVVSPSVTSAYTVVGTSTVGCLSSNTPVSTVSVNPLPTVSISTTNTLICLGGSATLSASGALSYTFDPGGIVSYIMVIFPTQTSTYTLTGSNADRCSNKAMITVSVDACTDIGPLSKRDGRGLRLFPNPTTGIFNLELDSDNEVTVINAIGQIVYSSRLSSGNHQINLETLASGLYVLNVGNTVDSRSIKIVKQ